LFLQVNAVVLISDAKDASSESSSEPEVGRKKRSPPTKASLTQEYIDALLCLSEKPENYTGSDCELISIQRV